MNNASEVVFHPPPTPSYNAHFRRRQDQINEWFNMTGFLCSLGGVCLPRPTTSRSQASCNLSDAAKKYNALSGSSQDVQYCPVTQ